MRERRGMSWELAGALACALAVACGDDGESEAAGKAAAAGSAGAEETGRSGADSPPTSGRGGSNAVAMGAGAGAGADAGTNGGAGAGAGANGGAGAKAGAGGGGTAAPGNCTDACEPSDTQACAAGKQTACVPDANGCLHMAEVQCAGGICIEGDRCAYVINRQWGGTRGPNATGVDFDAAGNAYVAASTVSGLKTVKTDFGFVGTEDAALIKWNARGQLVWALRWGTEGWDGGADVVVESEDRIYTVGTVDGELYGVPPVSLDREWPDVGMIRVNGAGAVQWSTVWGSEASDGPRRIALGGDGVLYVSGSTEGLFDEHPPLGESDLFVSKLSGGERQWTRMLATSTFERSDGLSVDAHGNVYLAGSTSGMLGGAPVAGPYDAVLAKWAPDGERVWVTQWGDARSEFASDVTIVGERVYVVGGVVNDQDPSSNSMQAFIAEFDADGNQVWVREWGSPDARDSAAAIEADGDGNLYVCGESGDVPGTATVLASENSLLKLDPDGRELWSVRWGSSSWDGCSDLALGPNGLIATVGRAQGKYEGSTITDGPALSLVRIQ